MRWISDPAHGWLQVSYKELAEYGMGVSDFSQYSYYSDSQQCVWLEEDCDASKFAAKARPLLTNIPETYLDDSSERNAVRRQRRIGS